MKGRQCSVPIVQWWNVSYIKVCNNYYKAIAIRYSCTDCSGTGATRWHGWQVRRCTLSWLLQSASRSLRQVVERSCVLCLSVSSQRRFSSHHCSRP